MGDRVKSALFNTLGDISNLTVLDAFSGSGALGLEAASRGAAKVVMIDADKTACTTIEANIESLGVERVAVVTKAFVYSWMRRNNDEFDIVIADPPYDDLQYKTLEALPRKVKTGGILVYSLPRSARLILQDGCELLSSRSYGDATLAFYRKIR